MTVKLPAYDRSKLTPGIIHIGLGNFHRAHMAVYLDDLFAMGLCHDWAILGAGVRDGDARMREALKAQGYKILQLANPDQGLLERRRETEKVTRTL